MVGMVVMEIEGFGDWGRTRFHIGSGVGDVVVVVEWGNWLMVRGMKGLVDLRRFFHIIIIIFLSFFLSKFGEIARKK